MRLHIQKLWNTTAEVIPGVISVIKTVELKPKSLNQSWTRAAIIFLTFSCFALVITSLKSIWG